MLADKFTQIERSHRRVLLAAMAAVASVGLYKWILAPYTGQLLAAQHYESTLDGAIQKAGNLDTTLESEKVKIDELTKEYDRQKYELFTAAEAREFFASLPNIVRQAGCMIQSVSSVPESKSGSQNQPADGTGISPRKAVVSVIGGYSGLVEFLGRMQRFERKVWIDSVKMETGGTGALKCQVVLTLYCIERAETN